MMDLIIHIPGKNLQAMTSVASLQYLSDTLSTMGIAGLLAGVILLTAGCLRNKRFFSKLSHLYLSGLLLVLIINGGLAFASCQRYAMRGFATENFLKTILDHSHPDDIILIAGNPLVDMEGASAGISTYLHKYNRHNLFIYPVAKTEEEKKLSSMFLDFYQHKDVEAIADKGKIKIVAIFPGSEKSFEETNSWFDTTSFNRYEFMGNYVVYAGKNRQ
jgi:hypothetical protein